MADLTLKARLKASEAQIAKFVSGLDRFVKEQLDGILAKAIGGDVTAREASRLLGKVFSELEKAGLSKEIEKAKKIYESELENIADDFKALGVKRPFSDADQATVGAMITTDLSKISPRLETYTAEIRSRMMRSIIGGETVNFNDLHAEVGGRVASQLETELNTNLQAFSRTATAAKADELGFNLFVYLGPDDSITRPFCEKVLGKNPPIYTREEIDAMHNGQIDPVMTYGGGYNCRHHWRPISEEDAKKRGYVR